MSDHEDIREELFEIDADDFDDFVADLWGDRGYEVDETDDRRAAFKATKGGRLLGSSSTELVEPVYSESDMADKSDVNRVLEYRFDDDVDELVVVTTTEFTEDARKQGKREEVKVLNGEELADLILEEKAQKVLRKYTSSGSALKGLFWLFVILPMKLCVLAVKITVWFCLLPFKILGAIFGSSPGSDDS
jgi:hypothetical protein